MVKHQDGRPPRGPPGGALIPCVVVGSGVVRIDPLRFLARCRTRRLNQAYSVCHILACLNCVVLYQGSFFFYVLLVFVGMCSVFWLF